MRKLRYKPETVIKWLVAHGAVDATNQYTSSGHSPWKVYTMRDGDIEVGFKYQDSSRNADFEPFWFWVNSTMGNMRKEPIRCKTFRELKAELVAALLAGLTESV